MYRSTIIGVAVIDRPSIEQLAAGAQPGAFHMSEGTVSAMLSADGGSLLVHCLHTDDPDGVRDDIKTRYEARLKEIFG